MSASPPGHGDGAASRDREDRGKHAERGEGHGEHIVRLDPGTCEEFGIEVQKAASGWIGRTVTLPAEVRPNQDRLAHIAPRFSGIARKVWASVGDRVESGQLLAVVESEALTPFDLETLIEGVVIEKHITRGEPVSPGQTAFVVADLRDVWIDINAYQKDLDSIRTGQRVWISAGHELEEVETQVSYVAPVVSEVTRTATVRAVVPNPTGRWRPGSFVSARVELERAEARVAVPNAALQEIEGRTVVFVEEGEGFVARPVRVGRRGAGNVEILSGLDPGTPFVATGGFTVKSELLRGELSGGHHH